MIITIGLELLKTIGQVYLNVSSANPAYHVVAGAVGMLLFLKLLNVFILFAASHAATGGTAWSSTWPRAGPSGSRARRSSPRRRSPRSRRSLSRNRNRPRRRGSSRAATTSGRGGRTGPGPGEPEAARAAGRRAPAAA
nr:hypothetical protein GCM10020093_022060 [Planobispora longispora]